MGSISLWSPEHGNQRQGSFVKLLPLAHFQSTFHEDEWMGNAANQHILESLPTGSFFLTPPPDGVFWLHDIQHPLWPTCWQIWPLEGRLALKNDLEFSFVMMSPLLLFNGHFFVYNQDRMGGNVPLWHHVPEFQACLLAFSTFPGVPVLIPGPRHPGMELMGVHSQKIWECRGGHIET